MRRLGVTLVEVLVVVAIIGLLATILLPVYAQAGLAAKRASCLSNTKQLSLAFQMYLDDHDGGFPLWGYTDALRGPNDAGLPSIWFNAVMPYAGSRDIMVSPGDVSGQVSRHPLLWQGKRIELPRLSYPLNDILGGGGIRWQDGRWQHYWTPAVEPEFANPPETVVVAAGKINGSRRLGVGGSAGFGERFGWLLSGAEADGIWDSESRRLDALGAPFFREGTNFAFGDGHARYVRTRAQGFSVLNQTLPWEQHIVPTQDCASWKVPSTDHAGPGITPERCRWW